MTSSLIIYFYQEWDQEVYIWWHTLFDVLKLPPEYITIHYWGHTCIMDWKVWWAWQPVLRLPAAKVKACYYPLQMLNVTVQVYPTLQLMQAKVLAIKLWGWKFRGWPVDHENLEIYIPWKSVDIRYVKAIAQWHLHNNMKKSLKQNSD